MERFLSLLAKCEICPRRCRADRLQGERGYCGVGDGPVIAHYGPHFGEEPPISGSNGSGNIFFSSCNLRCVYCQNYQISHTNRGRPLNVDGLMDLFFELAEKGVHNINLVSPTPYAPFVAAAIEKARRRGFTLPFVYNTHAYETVETLHLLDGLVDIYLPDFKYWGGRVAGMLSHAHDYPEAARASIAEMKRQVGNLCVENGIARRGLLVRHLVLPGNLAGSRHVMEWISETLGNETFLSLMSQYQPLHRADDFIVLTRNLRLKEYESLLALVTDMGFESVFVQDLESAPLFVPDFDKPEPFAQGESKEP